MSEFNRLFREMMDGIGTKGQNFDNWNLQQVGLKKRKYVSAPKKVPLTHSDEPQAAGLELFFEPLHIHFKPPDLFVKWRSKLFFCFGLFLFPRRKKLRGI